MWADDYFPEDAGKVAERICDILLRGIASQPQDLARLAAPAAHAEADRDRLSQQSFLRTATALINQFGYRGASVDRISAELGVTKGAFYHYNETRDGLVVSCFEHSFGLLREAQDEAVRRETTGVGRVAAAAVALVNRQMRDSGTLLRTSALTALGPELRTRMAWELSRLTRRFGDMLNDGLIDGSVRPCNVNVAAEMITAMINSAEELDRWVRTATVETAADLYVRPLLEGLLPK